MIGLEEGTAVHNIQNRFNFKHPLLEPESSSRYRNSCFYPCRKNLRTISALMFSEAAPATNTLGFECVNRINPKFV